MFEAGGGTVGGAATMAYDEPIEHVPELVTLRLSPEARHALEAITRMGGVTLAEAIRRALGTEKFLLEQRAQGACILVEDKNGRQKELMLP